VIPSLPPAPPPSSSAVRSVMQGNRGQDTKPEVLLRAELHRRGLRFRKHAQPLPDVPCRVDIVFSRARVAVFVDGCFWHRCPKHGVRPHANAGYWNAKLDRNVARDSANDAALRTAGWLVLRVWEHERPPDAADRVEQVVRGKARMKATDAPDAHGERSGPDA
jgi:DNA mismatch endonuclease (patch repair protein)